MNLIGDSGGAGRRSEQSDAGTLPADVRFQVCLPAPLAVGYWFGSPSSRPNFIAAYGRAFRADLAKICTALPHDDLAIQWDICAGRR